MLQGVAALACGLAALEAAGRCAEEDATRNLFLSGTLVKLLERCPSVGARRAVMAIAAALPALDASQEVRGRWAGGQGAGQGWLQSLGAGGVLCVS